jgi:hypothetical protein
MYHNEPAGNAGIIDIGKFHGEQYRSSKNL